MGRIVRFAIASAMRQEEICRIRWSDVDVDNHMVLVRDRKDPREKDGNDQPVPLLSLTGFNALRLVRVQRRYRPGGDLIFPYNPRSVGTAFRRACKQLKIKNLHFHDLRHEATSRLFEAGLRIEQVALVTGHRDWKMLKRYTHLRPEHLHLIQKQATDLPRPLTVQAASATLHELSGQIFDALSRLALTQAPDCSQSRLLSFARHTLAGLPVIDGLTAGAHEQAEVGS